MDLNRWQEVRDIVAAALDLPPEERTEYLDVACQGDADLRQQVDALLAVSSADADVLDDVQFAAPGFESISFGEGDTIGDYTILRGIGHGGMSSVYLARDERHDREVALKFLHPAAPPIAKDEKRVLARLNHPNIATLYDSGQTDTGVRYVALEYIEGEPITEYCAHRQVGLQKRLALFRTVCSAVEFAHRNLIVHRDLKPGNILVTPEGVPKLLDFGIAKVLDAEVSEVTQSAAFYRPLTIAFASPEQLEGQATSTATDVYSLGVLLSLLISGRLPYQVTSIHDLPWAIRNMEPRRPSHLIGVSPQNDPLQPLSTSSPGVIPKRLQGDLDAIVLRCLRKEPDTRYPSVQALSEDVRRFLDQEPVTARQGSRRYRLGKFIRRHRVAVAVGLGFVLLLLVFIGVLGYQLQETRRERDKFAQISGFLETLFEVSDPSRARGNEIRARELLDRGAREFTSFETEPEVRGDLAQVMGTVYRNLGLYDEADPLLQDALSIAEDLHDPDHREVIEARAALGSLRMLQGRYREAEEIFREAQVVLEEHADAQLATEVLGGLAAVLYELGRYEEAESLYRDLLQLDLPQEEALELQTHLATTLAAAGKLEEAEALFTESLKERRAAHGPRHPELAEALNNFGLLLLERNRFDEARACFEEALTIDHEVLGEAHPHLATTANNLGLLYAFEGKPEQAKAQYLRAISLLEEHFGETHPFYAKALTNLAILRIEKREYEEAEDLLERALDLKQQLLGSQHPSLIPTLNSLAGSASRRGDHTEAEQLYARALQIGERAYGQDHPFLLGVRNNLGSTYHLQENWAAAEEQFQHVVEAASRLFAPDDRRLGLFHHNLAYSLQRQERFSEAAAHYEQALRIRETVLSPDHPSLVKSKTHYAFVLRQLGRDEEAEAIAAELAQVVAESETRAPTPR